MPLLEFEKDDGQQLTSGTMKAVVFGDPEQLPLEEKPIPKAGPSDAIIKVSLTTICGTDIPIVHGEYPADSGLTIGHEAVSTNHELGGGRYRIQTGTASAGEGHYPLRPVRTVPGWPHIAMRRSSWWLATGKYNRRRTERIFPCAVRTAKSTPISDHLADERGYPARRYRLTGFSAVESGQEILYDLWSMS